MRVNNKEKSHKINKYGRMAVCVCVVFLIAVLVGVFAAGIYPSSLASAREGQHLIQIQNSLDEQSGRQSAAPTDWVEQSGTPACFGRRPRAASPTGEQTAAADSGRSGTPAPTGSNGLPARSFASNGYGYYGDGTAESPFLISTAEHLDNIRNYTGVDNADTHFMLTNNIDLTEFLTYPNAGYNNGAGWLPIGRDQTATYSFHSHLDGGGYTISGLWINRPTQINIGLFGYLVGKINNLNIILDQRGIIGMSPVGAISGVIRNATQDVSMLQNLSAQGSLFGNSYWGVLSLGGLFGRLEGIGGRRIELHNSQFFGSLIQIDAPGAFVAGGLAGAVWNASIVNSLVKVDIQPNQHTTNNLTGGLVGRIEGNNTIANSFAFIRNAAQIQPFIGGRAPFGAAPLATITNSFYHAPDRFVSPDNIPHLDGNSRRLNTNELSNLSNLTGWDFAHTWGFDYGGNLVLRTFGEAYDPTRAVTINITGTGAEGVTHDAPATILQRETVLQFTLTGVAEDAIITLPDGATLSGMKVTIPITAGEAQVLIIEIVITAYVPPPPDLTWLWILLGVIGGLILISIAVLIAFKLRKPKTITETVEIEKEIIVEKEVPIIKKSLPSDLSKQERRVAELMLKGKSRREIADAMDLVDTTVGTYIQRIFAKTGSNSVRDFLIQYFGKEE